MTCIYLNFTFWLHFSKENQYFITCTDSSDFLAHASTFWSETSASIRALSTSTGRSVIDATVVESLQNPSFFLLQSFEFLNFVCGILHKIFVCCILRNINFAKHESAQVAIKKRCLKQPCASGNKFLNSTTTQRLHVSVATSNIFCILCKLHQVIHSSSFWSNLNFTGSQSSKY